MRVAAFQFDVRVADPEANLAAVERGLLEARERDVELVLLPEMWTISFLPDERLDAGLERANEAALEQAKRWSAELGLVIAGSALGPRRGPRSLPTNRLTVHERGEAVLEYDKVHLFTPTAEGEAFAPGEAAPATIACAGAQLSGVVCYDLRFPEILRVPFRAGAELLLACAQWPDKREGHWRSLVIARAIENQCFVLGTNRTGVAVIGRRKLELRFPGRSLIVSPLGEVLAEAGSEPGLTVADIDFAEARRYRRQIPAQKDERRDLYAQW